MLMPLKPAPPNVAPLPRMLLTHPLLPSAAWAVIMTASAALGWTILAWVAFGGAAGYALSGSV